MNPGALGVRIRRATWLFAAIAFALLLLAAPANAAFPGKNGKIAYVERGSLVTVNPDGTGKTVLPAGAFYRENPTWSPDGRRLAVDRLIGCGGDGCFFDLATLAADGSDEGVVRGTTISALQPAWSPDGTQLAYAREFGDVPRFADVWAVNLDGTNNRRIAEGCGSVRYPDWSPDGGSVAFGDGEGCGGSPRICVEPLSGPFDRCSYATDGLGPSSWSPDGTKLAFSRCHGFECNIFTAVVSTHQVTQLTNGPGSDFAPVWSPDGQRIAFESTRDDPNQCTPICSTAIFVMNADGSAPQRISDVVGGFSQEFPDWQPVFGPQRGDYKNAAKFCKADRDFLGDEAFAKKYGTNSDDANAFGKCVSQNN